MVYIRGKCNCVIVFCFGDECSFSLLFRWVVLVVVSISLMLELFELLVIGLWFRCCNSFGLMLVLLLEILMIVMVCFGLLEVVGVFLFVLVGVRWMWILFWWLRLCMVWVVLFSKVSRICDKFCNWLVF